jgi:hypothetical protein
MMRGRRTRGRSRRRRRRRNRRRKRRRRRRTRRRRKRRRRRRKEETWIDVIQTIKCSNSMMNTTFAIQWPCRHKPRIPTLGLNM